MTKSTSSPAAHHVSLFPKLEREMESETTAISGLKCCELYQRCPRPPDGSALRTCVASLVLKTGWYSSKCVLTWKTQDTPFNRLLFLLSPSMRTTDATESGLWATPRAGKTTDENPETWQKRKDKGDVSTMPLTLQAKMWPTPKGSPSGPDYARVNREGSGGDDLATAIAKDRLFPTPDAHCYKNGERGNGTGGGEQLSDALVIRQLLPTPSGMGENSHCSGTMQEWGGSKNPLRGTEEAKGSLNPAWVAWLMGFPMDWLDLDGYQNPTLEGLPPEYLTESIS